MNGYVMNVSNAWTHAMKRSIGPGAKIPLDELFEQYGIKHDLNEGPDFVGWLRGVKLRDSNKWKIIFDDDKEEVSDEEKQTTKKPKTQGNIAPIVSTKLTVEDVVGLSVRKARESLPKVTDLKLLKYSLQEANQLAGKDSLCNEIRKRIRSLQSLGAR